MPKKQTNKMIKILDRWWKIELQAHEKFTKLGKHDLAKSAFDMSNLYLHARNKYMEARNDGK